MLSTSADPRLLDLAAGRCHDPFGFLGWHPGPQGHVVRVFDPHADSVEIVGLGTVGSDAGVVAEGHLAAACLDIGFKALRHPAAPEEHEMPVAGRFAPFPPTDVMSTNVSAGPPWTGASAL